MKSKYLSFTVTGIILVLSALVMAQSVPQLINYQGRLVTSGGQPLDSNTVPMHFALLDGNTPGSHILWGETQPSVKVSKGIYNVIMGSVNPIPSTVVSGSVVYMEVKARGEVFSPRQRVTAVAFAMKAQDAANSAALGGTPSAQYYTKAQVDAAIAAAVAGLQTQINNETTARTTADTTITNNLNTETTSRTNADTTLGNRVTPLETKTASMTADADNVYFTSVNVNVRSGSGATDAAVNGKGNLIVGYNELRGGGSDNRTGSHNIIMGRENNYLSYGGLVSGKTNLIAGPFTNVIGGTYNQATGSYSTVCAGYHNIILGQYSSVISGKDNWANGYYSSVSGGNNNAAWGDYSSVSGGEHNEANGYADSVSGGQYNEAQGGYSSVSGGEYNIASGLYSSVSGGGSNTASGEVSSVSGGGANTASGDASSVSGGEHNEASVYASSVSGGSSNKASGVDSSVSGGIANIASGQDSSVNGGFNNTASGVASSVAGGGGWNASDGNNAFAHFSAILGGRGNLAGDPAKIDHYIGQQSTIGGGNTNTTSGQYSSISGGNTRSVSGVYDWRAGSLFEDQ